MFDWRWIPRTLAILILFVFAIDITTEQEGPRLVELQGPEEPLYWNYPVYEPYTVTITVYNALEGQTDSTPNITASGLKFNISKAGKYRIGAPSRNFLSRWGGLLKYGDAVIVSGTDDLDGVWIVQDTMNERYSDRLDLLVHESRKYGVFEGTMALHPITKARLASSSM